jgi:hypothetical protein
MAHPAIPKMTAYKARRLIDGPTTMHVTTILIGVWVLLNCSFMAPNVRHERQTPAPQWWPKRLSEPRRWLSARWKGWAPAPRAEKTSVACARMYRPRPSRHKQEVPKRSAAACDAAAAAALPERDTGIGGCANELTISSLARPRDATLNDSGPKRLAFALPDTLRGARTRLAIFLLADAHGGRGKGDF